MVRSEFGAEGLLLCSGIYCCFGEMQVQVGVVVAWNVGLYWCGIQKSYRATVSDDKSVSV
jgi:hypothetical protein